jgi:hypothetical protein
MSAQLRGIQTPAPKIFPHKIKAQPENHCGIWNHHPPPSRTRGDTPPMFELSQIILWILWRLRPVMAVEANLVDILQSGFALFRTTRRSA